ncbi:MAG TPA: AAA family ATPase [Pirellulales bacterium]|nr:AAA family ATPase [Pirellulales bacterium]
MRSIAVLNQKGGVGKTTTAVNLSAALAAQGHRVMLMDLDPQAHATLHLGLPPDPAVPSIYDVLTGNASIAEARRKVSDNLWVVGSHIDLAAAEVELVGVVGREVVLRDKLLEDAQSTEVKEWGQAPPDELRPRGQPPLARSQSPFFHDIPPLDFLLIDCPPSLGILTLNALAAVEEVFLPLQPHFLALHGLSKLLETIDLVARRINDRLRLSGIVFCLYESGTRLAGEVGRDVEAFFEAQRGKRAPWADVRLFSTRIRRNIRLAEAPSFGQSIFQYAPDSHGAEDYAALAEEVQRGEVRGTRGEEGKDARAERRGGHASAPVT